MNLGRAFRNIALEIYIKSHTVVHPALLYYFVLVYLLDLPSLRQLAGLPWPVASSPTKKVLFANGKVLS